MKAKLLVVSLSLIIAAACSKDKFGTNPVLAFESVNGETFSPGQTVSFKLRLTDKEGDFYSDSTGGFTKPYLFYRRYSYISPCLDVTDTIPKVYDVPAFPTSKFLDIRIDINYTYAVQGQYPVLTGCTEVNLPTTDSGYFKIWAKDDAGHVSDTVTTPTIVLLKNG